MEQNRTAAARCRLKKQARMGGIATETEKLEIENQELSKSLAELQAQVTQLREEFESHLTQSHSHSPLPDGRAFTPHSD